MMAGRGVFDLNFTCPLFAVQDIRRSVSFYQEVLGQQVAMDFGTNVTFQGGFALQEGLDQLAGFPAQKIVWGSHNAELYFESPNFDGDVAAVKRAGVPLLHDVREHPWGQRVLRFYDPDGHIVELGEAMHTVICRFLSQGMTPQEAAQRSQYPLEFVLRCQAEG